MGDTGSLVVGLILSVLAIKFIGLSFESLPFEFPYASSPDSAAAIDSEIDASGEARFIGS